MYGNGIDAYRQTNVVTADPRKLVVMCYEDAVKHLKTALTAYESNDYEAKARSLAKVHDIVAFLIQSLDFTRGGDIARALDSLYNYILRRLMDGDLKRDKAAFDEVIHIFEELLSSWRNISVSNKESGQGTTISVKPGKPPERLQNLPESMGA